MEANQIKTNLDQIIRDSVNRSGGILPNRVTTFRTYKRKYGTFAGIMQTVDEALERMKPYAENYPANSRTCLRCDRTKPAAEFVKAKQAKRGRLNICSECLYLERNTKVKETICPVCGDTRWVRARCAKAGGNPCAGECSRKYKRGADAPNYKGTKHISGVQFGNWRRSASKRRDGKGIPFDITIDDVEALYVKQNGRCALSGRALTATRNDPNKLSLDRKDSSKGYVVGNIQLLTADVNKLKWELTPDEFVKLAVAVVKENSITLAAFLEAAERI